ncbi:uncharacterized protein (UPF0335 family) [Evansella vedderi]|uniref:Uncharacterized protein (UPF0335 family) n=1 Tax=Evansella vedderi TaxID=38282 RepID=A0ABT9ZTP2_9BACI|nr:hypothetical protein [Evansella vedderi]MDQ0254610.1 uncharacterized protein (UPF0335 family) [Evansella vedderi]
MLNRIVYGGEVYYKVTDLAELFELSQYKIKKILKEQEIETTTLKGFGRSLFVIEKNVCAIEVNGEITIIKTEVKETKKKELSNDFKKTMKKTAKLGRYNKQATNVIPLKRKRNNESDQNIEALQKEHSKLIKQGSAIYFNFHTKGKESIAKEIVQRHLGKGGFLKKLMLMIL